MTSEPQDEPIRVRLPAALDMRSAESLAAELLALRGRPVEMDASGVERLGGLGLQVLLSARLTWRADRVEFAVVDPSGAFHDDCVLLGASMFDNLHTGTAR